MNILAFKEFLISLVVALVLCVIFALGTRRTARRTGFVWFFLFVLMATWAGGVWIRPRRPGSAWELDLARVGCRSTQRGRVERAPRVTAGPVAAKKALRCAPSIPASGGTPGAQEPCVAPTSQGGRTTAKMHMALSEQGGEEEEETFEDKINRVMEARKMLPNASYFAFTATPKNKTLEIFGEPCPAGGETKHRPFHSYTKKQAIQEGFIVDVLAH